MSVVIDYQTIWDKWGYGRDNRLGDSLKYIDKEAKKKGIPKEIMEAAIRDIFIKCSERYKYSTKTCSCGCGIDKSGTDITHAIRDHMFSLERERMIYYGKMIEDRTNKMIIDHITKENNRYLQKHSKPNWFIRALKWFFVN